MNGRKDEFATVESKLYLKQQLEKKQNEASEKKSKLDYLSNEFMIDRE